MTSFEVQRILIHYIVRYIEQVCMPKTILLHQTQNQKKTTKKPQFTTVLQNILIIHPNSVVNRNKINTQIYLFCIFLGMKTHEKQSWIDFIWRERNKFFIHLSFETNILMSQGYVDDNETAEKQS